MKTCQSVCKVAFHFLNFYFMTTNQAFDSNFLRRACPLVHSSPIRRVRVLMMETVESSIYCDAGYRGRVRSSTGGDRRLSAGPSPSVEVWISLQLPALGTLNSSFINRPPRKTLNPAARVTSTNDQFPIVSGAPTSTRGTAAISE